MKARRLAERDEDVDEDDEEEEQDDDALSNEESDVDEEESNDEETQVSLKRELADKVRRHQAECYSSIIALFYPELPRQEMCDATSNILTEQLVDFEDSKAKALVAAGMIIETPKGAKAESIPLEITYDRLASPFTSTEGKEAWDQVLSSAVTFDKKKKGAVGLSPAPGSQGKGNKSNFMVASKEQVNIYYKNLYESARDCLYSIVDSMFDSVGEIVQRKSDSCYPLSNDLDIAMLQSSDVFPSYDIEEAKSNPTKRGQVVFVNIAGEYFTSVYAKQCESSFDTAASEKTKTLRTIEKVVSYGAKAVVCLYESYQGNDESFLESVIPAMESYFDVKNAETIASTADEVKVLFDIHPCKTMAEIMYSLQQLSNQQPTTNLPSPRMPETPRSTISTVNSITSPLKKKKKKRNLDPITVPVFVLEDIRLPGVIPSTPAYEAVPASDDDIPLSIGEDDNNINIERSWYSKKHRQSSMVDGIMVDCCTSPTFAIQEILGLAQSIQSSSSITWIEDSLQSVYPIEAKLTSIPYYLIESSLREQGSILTTSLSFLSKRRLCSERIREATLWSKVISVLPKSKDYFNKDISDPLAEHLQRIFPKVSVENPRKVKALAVIGGKARLDKFVTMYRLLDLVDNIYISGELMVPFLSSEYKIAFPQYNEIVVKYSTVCQQFMTKARIQGVNVTFPVDIVVGDLPVSNEIIADSIKPREGTGLDDGADYEGDILNISISDGTDNRIEGYVFDIGKESIPLLRQEILSSDMILVWGSIGACEYTSFQDGQRGLVESASQVAYDDRSNPLLLDKNKPSQTIVIGNCSVEWYSRLLDSDKEAGGDLESIGVLAYAQRQSKIMTGLLGLTESKFLAEDVVYRPASSAIDEWVFHSPPKDDEEED
jgi:hypothetical protein